MTRWKGTRGPVLWWTFRVVVVGMAVVAVAKMLGVRL